MIQAARSAPAPRRPSWSSALLDQLDQGIAEDDLAWRGGEVAPNREATSEPHHHAPLLGRAASYASRLRG